MIGNVSQGALEIVGKMLFAEAGPTASDIRAANRNAVGGARKRCRKGKNCSAACIDPSEYCLVGLPEPVSESTSKVSAMLQQRRAIKRVTPAPAAPADTTPQPVVKAAQPKPVVKAAQPQPEPLTGVALEDAVKKMMRQGIYSPEEWAKGTGYVLKNKRGDVQAFKKASQEAKVAVEAEKKRKRAEERRRPKTEEELKQKEEEKARREEAKRQKEEIKKQKEEKEEREREELLKKIPSEKETGLYPVDQKLLRSAVETSDRILKREYPEGHKDRANIEKLSPEERGAIFMYSAGGRGRFGKEEYWVALNQKMRYGEVRDDKSPETAAAVNFLEKNLRSALDKLPPKQLTEYQRLDRAVSGRTAEQLKTLKPGDVFGDKGFGSYTTSREVVDQFLSTPDSVVVRVVNPRKAKDISAGTREGFGQQEHMYPGGFNFRVVKVVPGDHYNEETGESHTMIYVEEVD